MVHEAREGSADLLPAEEDRRPLVVRIPDAAVIDRVGIRRLVPWLITLEIRPEDAVRAQFPFTELPPVITQQDFPAIVSEVRRQNLAELGEHSDRPD